MAENFFGITNTGRIRDNNEDTFLAEKLPNGWIAACVIDGVGGYEGGEVAAEIARDTIREGLSRLSDPVQTLKETVLAANQNIYNEKLHRQGKEQMACVLTLALVDVENNQFYYAHVGDTRLYLLRDQSLVKVTKDHSFVGFLEDSGRLSEKEAMAHPKRNEINKALGFDPQLDVKSDYIETGLSPFLPGDMLLLCSDGLSDLVNRKTITEILLAPRSLPEKGADLVDEANTAGGKDNITVVLVHHYKKPLKVKATKPVITKKNETKERAAAVPVNQPLVAEEKEVIKPAKKMASLVWALAALSLLLAVVCVWLITRDTTVEDTAGVPVVAVYTPNDTERLFGDSLALAKTLFRIDDTLSGKAITIGDSLFVRQDTLRINGNGAVLQSDTAYRGAALVATNDNRLLLLENITFRNFETAIAVQGKSLLLRNVRFENCAVPVQRNHYLRNDTALTGAVIDTFRVIRSIPQ